jgi:short-subunit dehydrogenase
MPQRQTALITGASSGIGLELAKLFAQGGYDVVLTARNHDKLYSLAHELQERYSVKCRVLVKDLANPCTPQEIFNELTRLQVSVDILVNNAGFGVHGFFAQTSLKRELEMIQVNLVSLTELTKLFLPAMVKNRYGRILNVSSTAGFQPGPYMAIYYATKAYVTSFSEALWAELEGTGVTVTALCPGPTETNFKTGADLGETKLFKNLAMSASDVARDGYRGLMKGKSVVISGGKNSFFVFLVRLFPRAWVVKIVRRVNRGR